VTLAGSLQERPTSIQQFGEHFGLSADAMGVIMDELPNPALASQRFRFHAAEFATQLAFRSVELDSGAMLTAESKEFDEIFQKETLDAPTRRVRFSAEGRIVNEKVTKSP